MLPIWLLDTAVAVNGTACFLIGCTLNITLIWLTHKRSPDSLRTYSRVLLQSAVLNIAGLTATAFYSPVQLAGAKGAITYGVGWLAKANDGTASTRAWNFGVHCAWVYMVGITQYPIVAPFLFRYFAVCHSHRLTGLEYGSVLAATAIAAAFFLPCYILDGVIFYIYSLLNCPRANAFC